MKLLLDKLSKLKHYGWNERVQTDADFDLICFEEGILVFNVNMKHNGLYTVLEDVPVILLNETLRGIRRLEVGFHELGHHFLHSPATHPYSDQVIRKVQFEAQAVAACALIPEPSLPELLRDEERNDYVENLLEFRLYVLETYGI